ncbi:tyrosine-type recombinase/integrase, partial [Acinetobacter baumannii]
GRKSGILQRRFLHRVNAWDLVRRRARKAGLKEAICNHTFRGPGITTYLENGGQLERAADMAGHADPRTTRLYDRRSKQVTMDDVSRI